MSVTSSSFSSSKVRSVFGSWRKAASPASTDVEAQVVVGTNESFDTALPLPIPTAHIRDSRTRLEAEEGTDPVDDFFGVVHSSPRPTRTGTRDSRHDGALERDTLPPPYASVSELPAYTAAAEPQTLAKYFFLFGFLFPLFWLAGSLILVSSLRAPAEWEIEKTEAEREQLIADMRRMEVKWAKRCLLALSVLLLAIAVVVVSVVFATRQ
ncbi:hypothetical protein B0H21DRAFT_695578 [Amylocystis lapponica]|nr:hypothetical protein B0H21DRAFT_695578 [Amylocystis lapponica]